jgi:hypothetical protein
MRTRFRSPLVLLPVLALTLLSGCADLEPGYESTGGSGALSVQNDGGNVIYRVRFSTTDDSSWGEDRLGSDVIAPGARRTWSVPAGSYHVKVEYQDGSALDSLEVYEVPSGGEGVCRVTGGAAPAATGHLVVENASALAIYRVRIKPTTDTDWGSDRLGSETIAVGARRAWDLAPGPYHVKIELQDGRALDSLEVYQVPSGGEVVCRVTTGPPVAAATGRLVVENGSGQAIYRVRWKLVTETDWGIDRLGSETIVDGARRAWEVPVGRYHVKVEFQDGRVLDSLEEYAVPVGGEVACSVWRQQ